MTVEQTRLDNLRLLVTEKGTIAAVAEAAGTPASYLSQILTRAPSRTGKPRDIGSQLARKLEAGCTKPAGWMDVPHRGLDDEDSIFLDAIRREVVDRDLSPDMREALLTLFRSAPKRGSSGAANDPNGPASRKKGSGT